MRLPYFLLFLAEDFCLIGNEQLRAQKKKPGFYHITFVFKEIFVPFLSIVRTLVAEHFVAIFPAEVICIEIMPSCRYILVQFLSYFYWRAVHVDFEFCPIQIFVCDLKADTIVAVSETVGANPIENFFNFLFHFLNLSELFFDFQNFLRSLDFHSSMRRKSIFLFPILRAYFCHIISPYILSDFFLLHFQHNV